MSIKTRLDRLRRRIDARHPAAVDYAPAVAAHRAKLLEWLSRQGENRESTTTAIDRDPRRPGAATPRP